MPSSDCAVAETRRIALASLHDEMARIRAFEEAVAVGYRDRALPGLLHLSMGGEAVAVGVAAALGSRDRVYSSHRPNGHFLATGTDPRALMAELAGRETGLCRGRGGSMHLAGGTDSRAVMATGIVGGTLAIAVGHSLAQAAGDAVVVFFGDGAVQNGAFHESLNMAALWKAPVLFVCENNGWVEFSSREEHTTVGAVARYGPLFGLPALTVDGSDVEAVAAAAAELLGPVRAGASPALLECSIARLRPHYEGDLRRPDTKGDPLTVAESALVALGADAAHLEDRRSQHLQAAHALLASVLDSDPFPDPADDSGLVFAAQLA